MSARKLRLVISPAARSDLRDLLAYTERQWGKAQRRAYKQELYQAFDHLARFPALGQARPEYGAYTRTHRVQQHVVVYRVTDVELRIARVIHVRRDLDSALEEPVE